VQAQDNGTAQNADALYAQGMAHYRRREWPEARACFARLKAIAPGRRGVDALLNEVDIFIQLQEMQPQGSEKSATAQIAQEALPSHSAVARVAEKRAVPKRRSLGPVLLLMVAALMVAIVVLYATGTLDTIIGNQRQARVRSLVNQGRAALNVGDCDRAATAFGEALALSPTNEEIKTWYAKAQRCQRLTALYEQAEAAILTAEWDTALEKLGEIIQLDPTYKDASDKIDEVKSQQVLDSRLIEAQAYLEQDDWTAAIQILEELKEQAPSFREEDVDRTLFLAYFRKGISLLGAAGDSPDDLMQAIQNFDLALAVSPGDTTAQEERRLADLYRQARLAFNQQNWPQAVVVLSEIHESRPDYMDGRARSLLCTAHLRLGDAYEAAGDLEQAVDQYRNVLAIEGCDPVEAAIKVREVQSTLYPPTATPTKTPTPTPTLVPTLTATVTPTPTATAPPPPPQKPTSPPPRTPTR
jgi:tetratricopeptide (TPR) repeat protein